MTLGLCSGTPTHTHPQAKKPLQPLPPLIALPGFPAHKWDCRAGGLSDFPGGQACTLPPTAAPSLGVGGGRPRGSVNQS